MYIERNPIQSRALFVAMHQILNGNDGFPGNGQQFRAKIGDGGASRRQGKSWDCVINSLRRSCQNLTSKAARGKRVQKLSSRRIMSEKTRSITPRKRRPEPAALALQKQLERAATLESPESRWARAAKPPRRHGQQSRQP